MDAVPFGAITLLDLAACGRRGSFCKIFWGFRRHVLILAFPLGADSPCQGESAPDPILWERQLGRPFRRRKGAGGSVDTLYLVFRCRWLGGNRGPGTPLFESAFVAVGLKCGSGKRQIRATLRFSRRARCPHRAVLGRPGVPPLRRESKPDSASGTGNREGRPYGFTKHIRNPGGRVRTPAPTANKEAGAFFA